MMESRLGFKQPDAAKTLVGAKPKHQFPHGRIARNALPVGQRIHKPRRGHHFETLVDADKELGRNDGTLYGAELHAFNLARNRA